MRLQVECIPLPFCAYYYLGPMAFRSKTRATYRAVIACMFVFWLMGAGLTSKAIAGCGDYLHHENAPKGWSSQAVGQLNDKQGPATDDDSSPPSSRCKNGSCKSAPLSLPSEPSRIVAPKQQPNHFLLSSLTHACRLTGMMTNSDDDSPVQPSLDLLDPPPRASAR